MKMLPANVDRDPSEHELRDAIEALAECGVDRLRGTRLEDMIPVAYESLGGGDAMEIMLRSEIERARLLVRSLVRHLIAPSNDMSACAARSQALDYLEEL